MTQPSSTTPSLFLTESQLADRWQLESGTLRKWRALRTGPEYFKIGGAVRYREEDVLHYEQSNSSAGRPQ